MTPMETVRPFSQIIAQLRVAGLRPTRQRIALGRLLFEGGDRHVTAEMLHQEAQLADVRVSLATVYNTLNQFRDVGLLREIVVDSQRCYFDTNTTDHHHFFFEETSQLADISSEHIVVSALPEAPEGTEIKRIDVVVRVA